MQAVGKGAYGTVCSARERATGERVAIKKIANCFDHVVDARYAAYNGQLLPCGYVGERVNSQSLQSHWCLTKAPLYHSLPLHGLIFVKFQ